MVIIRISILCFFAAIILAGCQNVTPEEKVYRILEESMQKEKTFEQQQEPLKEMESQESVLFKEIMDAGMKNEKRVSALSRAALSNLQKRKVLMSKEQVSILASKREFDKIKDPLSKINNIKRKKEVTELYQTMEERYKIHNHLFDSYKKGLYLDENVYKMLLNKSLNIDLFEKQIDKTNVAFAVVMKSNEDFNAKTQLFNNEKQSFYKNAGLNMSQGE
ncbi:YkyA family protein [Heyndrickxia acidicola]|uniref:YkyA family protein n=1 Tax=Heyndrickxia acidicola TaxID=209389 RepID=A0ABU6MHS7_9BACI|nr:YkyA family protein [Heyndrickxia acidicola]MED1204237.1 YkyA family protein [Heyndrickxia acidicola]